MAAGELSPQLAAAVAAAGVVAALAGSFALDPGFAAVAAGYLALQLLYSFWLKEMVILDAMAIAAGFVLRVTAGAVVIDVSLSPWIVLCTALLALFLAFAKRRHELLMVEGAVDHRPALEHYSESFLDTMIATVTAATIVFYSMYTFWAHEGHQRAYMMLSVPFVAYGLFRYLYLMHMKDLGGSPETVLLTDLPLILDIMLWVATVVAVLYFT
jgi:4-hydroxybenzoate polyprenyltransferase